MILVATFFTHHSAMMTHKALTKAKIKAKMQPVMRELSSSCGSCVVIFQDSVDMTLFDEDTEAVYQYDGKSYKQIYKAE